MGKLIFALLAFCCVGAQAQTAPLPFYVHQSTQTPAQARVLMVGDSITYSNCADSPDGLCGWRKALAAQCGRPADAYAFDTLSQIGISAKTVLQPFPASYAAQPTDFVSKTHYDAAFMLLGVNDIGAGLKNLDELEKNYSALADKVKALDVKKVYLMTIFPYCAYKKQDRPLSAKNVMEMNAFIRKLGRSSKRHAKSLGPVAGTPGTSAGTLGLLDIYAQLQDPDHAGCMRADFDSGDHLHPKTTPQVQDAIAGFIAGALKSDPGNPLGCR
jgi:lysophospholipase L1-like esterase